MKFRNVVAIASILAVLTPGLSILGLSPFSAPAFAQRIIARIDDRNEQVRRIQEALTRLGFFNSADITGFFGIITRNAVSEFQRVNRLPVTGVVDETTANLLFSLPSVAPITIARRGDSGSEVRRIQEALARERFFQANPTGFFGSVTEDAVIRFQRANNLPANGIVDQATSDLLFSRAGSSSSQDRLCNRTPTDTEVCPYVVMIPGDLATLRRIRQDIVNRNYLTQRDATIQIALEEHPRGQLIRIASYKDRPEAEAFANLLRNISQDFRVEYLPRRTR
ncbi:MAG: peptidoglycan-binding protein [Coleofasciculaceae cyanobacterium SM2_1_6]|nr:peptidoglycan-binding protein [Coleofasciculaceae cyanobacterium SM2_1_6]